ncbi:hypothetical protein, partial [Rhizobium laguerreae]|uniref:hypothetical protein n=1 Tax=Rhizobium laguerreae TaxID=1076926 RepID=UPI0021B116A9
PGRSTIKTIWLRASSDLQRLTKHENSIVQGIAAASVEVCDKPLEGLRRGRVAGKQAQNQGQTQKMAQTAPWSQSCQW